MGAGVLVGTSLAVIIPEGLHLWMEAAGCGEGGAAIGAALAGGFALMLLVDRAGAGGDGERSASGSAMAGLVVHAAVDGVAVGASILAGSGRTSGLVFAAIMLHKAPAAFGLASFLHSAGLARRVVIKQLLIFSAAAPVGAVATFAAIRAGVVGYQARQLALVMLFSGGTFLYVATAHILPEVMHRGEPLTWGETLAMGGGVLLPLLLNLGGHEH